MSDLQCYKCANLHAAQDYHNICYECVNKLENRIAELEEKSIRQNKKTSKLLKRICRIRKDAENVDEYFKDKEIADTGFTKMKDTVEQILKETEK